MFFDHAQVGTESRISPKVSVSGNTFTIAKNALVIQTLNAVKGKDLRLFLVVSGLSVNHPAYNLSTSRISEGRSKQLLSLELGDEVANKTCDCCGEPYKSVVGFIKQDNQAYAVYFATLQTGHPDITVGLTVSIGNWWDDTALNERHWIYIIVKPSPENFNMRIEEPSRSAHSSFKPLGIALTREEALASSMKEEFFAVADYVVAEDPAVNSYLMGQAVNIRGRICKH